MSNTPIVHTASSATITVLGCGTSGGVPQLHAGWGKCDPNNAKNYRHRSALLIEQPQHSLLVDTTPECRLQLIAHDITRITSILYTHTHADHCHGIDETRWICLAGNRALDVYGFADHLDDLQQRFSYAFTPLHPNAKGYYKPVLHSKVLEENNHYTVLGMPLYTLRLDHGFSEVLGFRIGNFAYTTDVVQLSQGQLDALKGIEYWIVDALRYDPHPTHAHLSRTLEWIAEVKPKQAYLTHMNGDMDYETLVNTLPPGVAPAYDGLRFNIAW